MLTPDTAQKCDKPVQMHESGVFISISWVSAAKQFHTKATPRSMPPTYKWYEGRHRLGQTQSVLK